MSLLALALLMGSGLSFISPAPADEGHGHSTAETMPEGHQEGMDHPHDTVAIPPGQPVPTVNLVVYPDPVSGWNLEIQTTNFRF